MGLKLRIAILASGKGSNLRVILEHARSGRLAAAPCLVLSNNPDSGAVACAKEFGRPAWSKSHRGLEREAYDREMLAALADSGAEAVVLAGYMRLLSPAFIQAFSGRILNVHPSLLPSFPGARGVSDALDYRARLAGCTVHFVEEELDSGAVIIQAALPVNQDDSLETLMPRMHSLEHRIYPQAIQWLAQGRLRREGRLVRLLPKSDGSQTQTASGGATDNFIVSPGLEDF